MNRDHREFIAEAAATSQELVNQLHELGLGALADFGQTETDKLKELAMEPIDFDKLIADAGEAFFKVIADGLPSAKTGDFDPASHIAWERASRSAALSWMLYNVTDDSVQSLCWVCKEPMRWISAPTGGWWAHETHPADDHSAVWSQDRIGTH